jgi:hypothetical protein
MKMRHLIIGLLFVATAVAEERKTACFDNLCGDAMYGEQFCSCHESGSERRCWSTKADCEVDQACCASTKSCKSTPYATETCGKRTSDTRKKRDAKK